MARILHFIGVAALFIAAVLLLVTTISSPVVGDIGILKIMLTNSSDIRHSSVTFGSFGHCVLDVAPAATDQDFCFPKSIGYSPMRIMEEIDHVAYSTSSVDSADALTRAFVLHPVACALAFIAAFIALAGAIGGLVGSMIAAVAWLITLVVMAIDFAAFGIVKDKVNGDGSGSHAYYSVGMWTTLAAMILLFIGMILVFFTCCSERRSRKNGPPANRHSHRGHKSSRDAYVDDGVGVGYGNDGYVNGRNTHFGRAY